MELASGRSNARVGAARSRVSNGELRRRGIVAIVFLIYALSLVEGPLRKWFLPQLSTPLIFLRDPLVITLYAYCFLVVGKKLSQIAYVWIAFSCAASIWGLFPYLLSDVDELGWVLGVRSYWLYMPLAFVVGEYFRRDDIIIFLIANVLIAAPYAALVAAQYAAGPGAWINSGVAGDDSAAVGVAGSVVRPFGLFTYTGQNVIFTAAILAGFVALYLSRSRIPMRAALLILGGAAVGTMCVLTGSRAIFFLAGFVLTFSIVGSIVARPNFYSVIRVLGILSFVALAAYMFAIQYPDMFRAMQERFASAEQSEGAIFDRLVGGPLSFLDPLAGGPPLGSGIGIGAPGVAQFLDLPPLVYGEHDLERNVNELGAFLGLGMVLLRFGTAVWLANVAVRCARRGDLMVLPLAAYAALDLATGSITNSPLNAFMPWLLFGLVLAIARSHNLIRR